MTQTNMYKSLKRKGSWVKIITTNNREHHGQICIISKSYITLDYNREIYERKFNLTTFLKRSQIESIEFLTCKNSTVWTKGK